MSKTTIRHFALGILFLFILCVVIPVSAHGGEPRLEISAERLGPGETLQIRGVEFEYDQEVTIELIGNQVEIPMGTVIADVEGAFTQNLVLPEDLSAGSYAMRARTYDHVVISPLFTVWGTAVMNQEDTGIREQSDVQLGPIPTLADAVATVDTAPVAVPSSVPQVPVDEAISVPGWNTNILIMALIIAIIIIGLVGLRKKGMR